MTDAAMSSDEEVAEVRISAAEEAALARKKRLLAMKSKIHGVQMKEEDYKEEERPTKRSQLEDRLFRNYNPNSDVAKVDSSAHDFSILEKEISSHLEETKHDALPETIDISTLQPKKVDWDLKRAIEKKVEKLERRTQRAIAQIIRQRLADGENDLATAVSAGTLAESQTS